MSDLVKRLELCPFCGSDELSEGYSAPPLAAGVECHNCGASLVLIDEEGRSSAAALEAEAIAAWNRRAESPELARLRSEVESRDLQLEVAAKAALKLADEKDKWAAEAEERANAHSLLQRELTTLTARTREVLAPFAAEAEHYKDEPGAPHCRDDVIVRYITDNNMMVGHFRAASTLFNELKEKDNG